ncbi:MerR family transcriptional regulator [Candidatus Methylacidiphilum infernorum]|uniref:MerR family transcriptional regulator n=1 Tax=Candidatus Methylacidiphilum infernorum TaxID=511746 RepID=A0ABX7PUI8_9BACT|nr:MerR family transcriptional regulator [Candidatus Methylacidiphilum infernorum]QSR86333.1 MerR family transcriptional regulator [Candidatus Methylacidiphilum infernorum]
MEEKTNNKPLTIGQVARLSAVGVETIRFYERRGLLQKPMRSPSGYRLYDHKAVITINFIKRAQALGWSLREIKELLYLPKERGCEKISLKIRAKIEELDNKISDLQRIKRMLKQLATYCKGNREGEDCPLLMTLMENDL